jgi:stage V sporulation protein D (sporulation-specific penicillin-binding protein)
MARSIIGFFLIIAIFVAITLRLFYWQVVKGESLRLQASAQYYLEFALPATRGEIMASDGNALVMNAPAYLAYAEPKQITDSAQFAKLVSAPLSLDEKTLLTQLLEKDRVWVPLAKKIDSSIVDQLQSLKLKGLGFEPESKRYYPESSMAAQLLGFVGQDQNGNDRGYFGLEGYYDRELRGIDGRIQQEKDVRGAPIIIGEEKRIKAENGRSLGLWIDRSIQKAVERRLLEGITKYGAKQGSVVVLDPKTGGILAMASYPSYDPTNYSSSDKSAFRNPIVAESYEPGSTFKVLVMASALNERVIIANTIVDENGPVKVGDYSIKTWNNEYHGPQTMTEVIQHSSNVGMVFIEKKLGKDKFIQYIKSLGFGKPTGVDLEDETSPDLRRDNEWGEIDLATASFGQGIAVTPIQMVRAVSAIANGGWLVEPSVVKKAIDSNGKVIEITPKKGKQVISREAAEITTEMMINAVDNGEAKWAKPKGYRIAGKTGTAQIPVSGHYDEKKTIASFVGFAPADNPEFVMLVTLREPSSSQWGSETAAPLFFSIARDILLYKGIAPQL